MKKYIFLTHNIFNIGGAQIYYRNKYKYLHSLGWEVSFYYASKNGDLIIHEISDISYYCPEILYSIYNYSQNQIAKVVNLIATNEAVDGNENELIVESSYVSCATWGELFASKYGGKHLIYLLPENNDHIHPCLYDFFIYKHKRKELAGINSKSLPLLFRSFYEVKPGEEYFLIANCSNAEDDVFTPFTQQIKDEKSDYVIGVFSRLNKPYLPSVINDICSYASEHRNKRFQLILIGGLPPDENNLIKDYKQSVSKQNNIKLVVTGFLYPVPTSLLLCCDVLISTAGSAVVCNRSGLPTIVYDAIDYKPIGILGRTTKNTTYRNTDEPQLVCKNLLEDILEKGKYEKLPSRFVTTIADYGKHMDFIRNSASDKSYYPILECRPTSLIDRLRICIMRFCGVENYNNILKLKITSRNIVSKKSKMIKHGKQN